jgi:hypothetical protein
MSLVDGVALEPVAGAKVFDGGQDVGLQALAPVEIGFFLAELQEELAHQAAEGGIALGGLDPGVAVDVIGE